MAERWVDVLDVPVEVVRVGADPEEAVLAAAVGKPTQVTGPTLDELDEAADQMAALVAKYVGRVAGYAARHLGGVITAAGGPPLHSFHLPGKHDQHSHGHGANVEPDQFGNHRENGLWYDDDGIYMTDRYVEEYGLPVTHYGFDYPDNSRDRYSAVLSKRGEIHVMIERDGGPGDALGTRDTGNVRVAGMSAADARSLHHDLRLSSDASLVGRPTDVSGEDVGGSRFGTGVTRTNRATGLRLTSAPYGAVTVSGFGKNGKDVTLDEGEVGGFMEALDSMASAADEHRGITASVDPLLVFEAPNQARDEHGRWTDGGGLDGSAEPELAATGSAGGYPVAAFTDHDGVYGQPGGRLVSIATSGRADWSQGPDEGEVFTAGEARHLAGGVDSVAKTAATLPTPTAAGAFDRGPALLNSSEVGGYRVSAFHDRDGDLVGEGQRFVQVRDASANWRDPLGSDGRILDVNLTDVPDFVGGIQAMAGGATASSGQLLSFYRTYVRDSEGRFAGSGGMSGEEFDSAVAGAALGKTATKLTRARPSSDQVDGAMREYGSNGHRITNETLRANHGQIPEGPEHAFPRRVSDGMDQMMSHQSLSRDIVVQRGVPDIKATLGGHNPIAGMQWVDHGFVSTSTTGQTSGIADIGRGGARLRILVPKGTRAASSERFDPNEVVLDRGLTFRAVRVGEPDDHGVRQIDVEVLR